jgi:hypothetical protein
MKKLLLFIAIVFFAAGYAADHFRGNSSGFRDSLAIVGPIQEHQFPKYGKTAYKLDYRSENEISIECLNGADPTSQKWWET